MIDDGTSHVRTLLAPGASSCPPNHHHFPLGTSYYSFPERKERPSKKASIVPPQSSRTHSQPYPALLPQPFGQMSGKVLPCGRSSTSSC